MTDFKEFVTPILKANGKGQYENIVDYVGIFLDSNKSEELLTNSGVVSVSEGYSKIKDGKTERLCPFCVGITATEDGTDKETTVLLSEKNAEELIRVLQKKLAAIKLLNSYIKPLL